MIYKQNSKNSKIVRVFFSFEFSKKFNETYCPYIFSEIWDIVRKIYFESFVKKKKNDYRI